MNLCLFLIWCWRIHFIEFFSSEVLHLKFCGPLVLCFFWVGITTMTAFSLLALCNYFFVFNTEFSFIVIVRNILKINIVKISDSCNWIWFVFMCTYNSISMGNCCSQSLHFAPCIQIFEMLSLYEWGLFFQYGG